MIAVKAEIYIQVYPTSADGIGELQRHVMDLVEKTLSRREGVGTVYCTSVQTLKGKLKTFPTECRRGLKLIDMGKTIIIDDGIM